MVEHVYIHIPFCLRKCYYCSFVSGFDISEKDIYIKSLIKEIRSSYKQERLKTLYFGGGTPSLLSRDDIEKIINLFSFEEFPEITLEANPETAEKNKFEGYKNAGINRISLGVQTFNNNILNLLGRTHKSKDIYNALEVIKSADFTNISIDLMYGLLNQTKDDFVSDLKKAVDTGIPHISAYGLKIGDNSYFAEKKPSRLPDDDMQADMYIILCNFLKNNGFIHYEISNFAKEGFLSFHNCAYWQNKNYYGFGLGASGYIGNLRYKNTANFVDYINNPLLKEEKIYLSRDKILEEEIFLALRLKNGINIDIINRKFNINFEKEYSDIIKKYESLGLLKIKNNVCFLSENGFLLSNNIMSEFINPRHI